jgi:ABC-type branched-subunit amino acid transport system substrate-binding protein
MIHQTRLAVVAATVLLLAGTASAQQKKYGPGVTDTEIKIGQSMPYSGPASAFGQNGLTETAYFKMVNERGGVNGRKINFISLDDGYMPPKTVEMTRKLVEDENVLFMFATLGTAQNLAIRKYLNGRQVPDIFVSTNSSEFNKPKEFPWHVPFFPFNDTEGAAISAYLVKNKPNAKIAVLFQHDDFGRLFLTNLEKALGPNAKMIVKTASYDVTDPTITSQLIELQASGADTLMIFATPKFAAQAIRGVHDLKWPVTQYLASVSSSIGAVLQPAGVEAATGVITAGAFKTPLDDTWANDKGMQDYLEFMKKWRPGADPNDTSTLLGYTNASAVVQVLAKCGDDLTRENVLAQTIATRLDVPMALPGVRIAYAPDDYNAFRNVRLQRFDGKSWRLMEDEGAK